MAEEKRESIVVSRLSAMKKAGIPPWGMVILMLFSTPGFYEAFWNTTEHENEDKVEASYEVMVNEVEHLRSEDARLTNEIQTLRQTILMLTLMSGKQTSLPDEMELDVSGIEDIQPEIEAAEDMETPSPQVQQVPERIIQGLMIDAPKPQRKALPDDLDDLVKK